MALTRVFNANFGKDKCTLITYSSQHSDPITIMESIPEARIVFSVSIKKLPIQKCRALEKVLQVQKLKFNNKANIDCSVIDGFGNPPATTDSHAATCVYVAIPFYFPIDPLLEVIDLIADDHGMNKESQDAIKQDLRNLFVKKNKELEKEEETAELKVSNTATTVSKSSAVMFGAGSASQAIGAGAQTQAVSARKL